MKKYRRIEITAFRRRVTIISGGSKTVAKDEKVCINDVDSSDTIKIESTEGQQILLDAMLLLKEKLTNKDNDEE